MNYWHIEIDKTNSDAQSTARTAMLLGSSQAELSERDATTLVLNALLGRGILPEKQWIRCHVFSAVNGVDASSLGRPDYTEGNIDMWKTHTRE